MDVRLTIYSEEKEHFSRVISLPCVIGRGKQCDVAIVHPLVSRRHCEIYEENGYVMTRDLGSLNGTFYHKTRIGRGVNIPLGDSFTIGKLHFKIEDAKEARGERNAVANPTDADNRENDENVEKKNAPQTAPEPELGLAPEPTPAPAPDATDKERKQKANNPHEPADDSVVIDLEDFLASDASVEQAIEAESQEEELLDLDSYLKEN